MGTGTWGGTIVIRCMTEYTYKTNTRCNDQRSVSCDFHVLEVTVWSAKRVYESTHYVNLGFYGGHLPGKGLFGTGAWAEFLERD